MKSEQFTAHELSLMLLALDMALYDIATFERNAKRKKDKERRRICQVMYLEINDLHRKAKGMLEEAPTLKSIDGGKSDNRNKREH
jgi:hypothetical protein